MRINICIEIAARLVNLHLAQQTGSLKLVERIINRCLTDFEPRCLGFVAQSLRRDMAIAVAKQ